MAPRVEGSQRTQRVSEEAERRRELVRRIAQMAREAGVPPEVALITALVESNFRNVNGGDRDSVGMFQQRDAWGSKADRMDPLRSAQMFLYGGNGGQDGAVDYKEKYGDLGPGGFGAWAQDVQVSAFPDKYQERLGDAVAMLRDAGIEPSPGAENFQGSVVGTGDGSVQEGPSSTGSQGSSGSDEVGQSPSNDAARDREASVYPLLLTMFNNTEISDLAALLGVSLEALKAMTPRQLAQKLQQAEREGKIEPGQANQMMQSIQSGDHFELPAGDGLVSMESSDVTSVAPGSPPAMDGVPTMPSTTASSSAGIPVPG